MTGNLSDMDGIIVADKPQGWTSHDVVAKVKRELCAGKVGHLGTLDPLATGVLPLVINRATKFARFLDGGRKEYLATLKLGIETDTYDAEGSVVASVDAASVTESAVREAFRGFTGRITQVPPMYSAVKRNGTPLYKLARRGEVVERSGKDVEIFSLVITGIELPYVEFRAVCSRGTYIRSICHDAGRILGCGAHLTSLRRLGSGAFSIDESVSPVVSREMLVHRIIPIDEALRRFDALS